MNRITTGIGTMKKQLADRVAAGLVTQAQIDETSKKLDLTWAEYVRFQEAKSLAVSNGTLTTDEGMSVYAILGESGPERFNEAPIEVKSVLTKLFAELIRKAA